MIDVNPKAEGLDKILKPWQQHVFRYLWKAYEKNKGTHRYPGESTYDIWEATNRRLEMDVDSKDSISRASVINFCKAMAKERYLEVNYGTGKGGERGYYKPSLKARTEGVFIESVIESVLISFQEDYAQQLANVVSEHFKES